MRSDLTTPSPTEPAELIRVLHIDDEREPLNMTKRMLEMADETLRVESVSTPEEALIRIREEAFDCVVSDFQMPRLDGIEVARMIRETSDVPFILYTGHGSEEVASMAFAVGIDDYVRKELYPQHYEVLANRIRVVVEKQRVEAELISSEARYRTILEESRDAVFVLDDESILYANSNAAELLGLSDSSEVIGQDAFTFIAPEDREMVREMAVERQKGSNVSSRYEFNLIDGDGRRIPVETHVSLIEYDGKSASLSFNRDITERKQIELALEESEEKFRVLTEKSVTGIYILQDSKMAYVNPSFAKMFGYSTDEIIGILSPEDLLHTDDRPYMRRRLTERLDGEIASSSSFYNAIRKDGALLFVEACAMLIEYQGKPAVMGTLIDVTERMRMEEELRTSEGRYRGMVMNSNDILAECDLNGRWTYMSPSVESILGYEPEEMLGKLAVDFMMSDDVEISRRDHKAIVEEGENVRQYEDRYVKKDGGVVTISWYL